MPSIERRPLPRDALSGARLGPLPASWLCCPDHRLATRLAPLAMTLRSPSGVGPPSARTLAREPRLSRPGRRSSTSATVSTRGHTRTSHRSPRARVGLAPRYSPASTDAGCVGRPLRHRSGGRRAAIRDAPRFRVVRCRSRGMCGSRAGATERRRPRPLDGIAWTLLVFAPSTRVTDATPRGAWIALRIAAPAEAHLGCPLAKGDTVGRTEVLSVATEPVRQRAISRFARARTRYPSRRLRGGIALGTYASWSMPGALL